MITGGTVEPEVQKMLDRDAIERLLVHYAHAADVHDVDSVMDVFAPDARISFDGGAITAEGFDNIKAKYVHFLAAAIKNVAHQMSNILVTVNGDTATSKTFAVAFVPQDRTICVRGIRYDDRFVRRSGEWKIRERQHRALWQYVAPLSESALISQFLGGGGDAPSVFGSPDSDGALGSTGP
jgi:uncharacterized protein (TIGR02246 family)